MFLAFTGESLAHVNIGVTVYGSETVTLGLNDGNICSGAQLHVHVRLHAWDRTALAWEKKKKSEYVRA